MAKQNKKLAQVFHYDLYGKRQDKYDFLDENSISSIDWTELENREPVYFFVQKDWGVVEKYEKGFSIDNILIKSVSGIKTQKDDANIFFIEKDRTQILNDFIELSEIDLKDKYNFIDVRDWKINYAKEDLLNNKVITTKLLYRPFDFRFTNYTGKTRGVMGYPRYEIMKHLIGKENPLLMSSRRSNSNFKNILVTKFIADIHVVSDQTYLFPLYLYPDQETDGVFAKEGLTEKGRKPNLNPEIVNEIAEKLGLEFTPEKEAKENTFAPIDILDYIYAVLHSPTYREKYKEFLKIDFPRVPYPKDKETFWQLVKLGGELRQIHLLESPKVEEYITSYPIDGDNTITTKISKKDWEITNKEKQLGRIWINDNQYFDNIPLVAWEFYIGGYQPAQKWLKDRKGRTLTFEDILHYQKIIVALYETDRIMKEIDEIEIE